MVRDLFTGCECVCVRLVRREDSHQIQASRAKREIGTTRPAEGFFKAKKANIPESTMTAEVGNVRLLRGRA